MIQRNRPNRNLIYSRYRPEPTVCIHADCRRSPDLDSPVPLCKHHGKQVWVHYASTAIRQIADLATVQPSDFPRDLTPDAERVHGFVYFMRRGEDIKIGWSRNVDCRAEKLNADAVLHYEPGTREDERRMHAAFAHLLIPGRGREWFRCEPDIMSFILRLKTGAA